MRFLVTAIDIRDNHLFINRKQIRQVKAKYIKLRKQLHSKGTKSAKSKYRYYRMSWAFAQLRQFIEYKTLPKA